MFHKSTGYITAAILLLSVSAQPMTSFAQEATTPAVAAQSQQAPGLKAAVANKVDGFSLEQLRADTETKVDNTKQWVRDKSPEIDLKTPLQTLDTKIDRLQDDVKPAGVHMKQSLKNLVPAEGMVRMGNRQVSVFGLILGLSFALVLILMSLSGPSSRLGGRH